MKTKKKVVKKAKKKVAKTGKSITIKLLFSEDDLNEILEAANFSDEAPRTVADLSASAFRALKFSLENSNFVDEIVEGSRDACANDWLCDFIDMYCPYPSGLREPGDEDEYDDY